MKKILPFLLFGLFVITVYYSYQQPNPETPQEYFEPPTPKTSDITNTNNQKNIEKTTQTTDKPTEKPNETTTIHEAEIIEIEPKTEHEVETFTRE